MTRYWNAHSDLDWYGEADREPPDWDDDDSCFLCGGTGLIEDECICGDDTCCCLVPTPPICPECGGHG